LAFEKLVRIKFPNLLTAVNARRKHRAEETWAKKLEFRSQIFIGSITRCAISFCSYRPAWDRRVERGRKSRSKQATVRK
jgi:hypothetical protein